MDSLLNPAHPDNGGKAAFFKARGFRPDEWLTMAEALRKPAATNDVIQKLETTHGCKYIVAGHLQSLGGQTPLVRTVWIVDRGYDAPRLVTAYPSKR